MRDRAWSRVTRAEPCPICEKPDWCTIGERGVCCMRIESDRSMRNGGWFHPFDTTPAPPPRPRPRKPARLRTAAALLARWEARTTPALVSALADALGVSCASLGALGAVYSTLRDAWAFPMRDGAGKVVGIRIRPMVGKKHAVEGSAEGLFYSADEWPGPPLICEGPTDCAAAMTLGFHGIGRPSCLGGVRQLCDLVERRGIGRAIIISDDDGPGRRGATLLAEALPIQTKLLAVPAKDLRAFVQAGASGKLLREMIRKQVWRVRGGNLIGRGRVKHESTDV